MEIRAEFHCAVPTCRAVHIGGTVDPMQAAFPDRKKINRALSGGFDAADSDRDGFLVREEFHEFMRRLVEGELNPTFTKKMFDGLDVVGNGKLTREQVEKFFRALYDHWDDVKKGKPPLEVAAVWFRAADVNRDGDISLEELRQLLQSFNLDLSVIDAARQVRKMDSKGNNDGVVQFYEFCQFYGIEVAKGTDAWEGHGEASKCCRIL
jgi:Ca2+-binding EF-hand superfamily protein